MKQHGLTCLGCGESIFSNSRHDFVRCSCGRIFVDGGFDYLRAGFKDDEGPSFRPATRNVPRGSLPRYFREESAA